LLSDLDKKFKTEQQAKQDNNLAYLNQLKKSYDLSKIQQLIKICNSLSLTQQNMNIVINMGKFFRFQDLNNKTLQLKKT